MKVSTQIDIQLPDSSERLRVLHVNSGNMFGGVETILLTLARLRHLSPGMEPSFALCYEGRLSRELAGAGVPVHLLGAVRLSRPWTVWRARARLRAILRQERFDVVVCHLPWSLAVFGKTVRAAGQPLAFWAHGVHSGRHWLERLARHTLPDLAIANSRLTADCLKSIFRDLPGQVLYSPVELERSPLREQWRTEARNELAVDEETVVIIQVSRLDDCKGHRLHLQALSLLKPLPGWVCWIVGGPQRPEEERYFQELQTLAATLGISERVRFLGQRSDVSRLLTAADVFCQPNEAPEGFGLVFIEALWAERPVVTTALGGPEEIVDESCGFLVTPGDSSQLAEVLGRLITSPDLRGQLGRAGALRAQHLCDPATQMKKLGRLMEGVTGQCRCEPV